MSRKLSFTLQEPFPLQDVKRSAPLKLGLQAKNVMKRRDPLNFAELLAEAGNGSSAGREEAKAPAPEAEPLRKEDALSLSVQGRKAIGKGKNKNSEKLMSEEREQSVDWQGNRVGLSRTAQELALDVEDRVAWETRLENKRKER